MEMKLTMKYLALIGSFLLISCGTSIVPPFENTPLKPFCQNGKSYLDLPQTLLNKLKEIQEKNNGQKVCRVTQYEYNSNTYFELKIVYSSYDIDGLYDCEGKSQISDNIDQRNTPFLINYRKGRKLIQPIYQ